MMKLFNLFFVIGYDTVGSGEYLQYAIDIYIIYIFNIQ